MYKIVPGVNNDVAIDLLTTHIRRKLKERSNHFRHKMAIPRMYLHEDIEASLDALNLTVLPMTPQRKVSDGLLLSSTTVLMFFRASSQC